MVLPSKINNLYRRLGLKKNASPSEIKQAYRRLARRWHPDVCGERGTNEFIAISEAYEVLSETFKKIRYDKGGEVKSQVTYAPKMDTSRIDPRNARLIFEHYDRLLKSMDGPYCKLGDLIMRNTAESVLEAEVEETGVRTGKKGVLLEVDTEQFVSFNFITYVTKTKQRKVRIR
jgi:curved DNA-binding protein CbpA